MVDSFRQACFRDPKIMVRTEFYEADKKKKEPISVALIAIV